MKTTAGTRTLKIFTAVLLAAAAPARAADPLPVVAIGSGAKGSVNFQVDDPAIYAQTKIVKLVTVPASELEPFIRSRLSRFGSVQVNDAANQLIITDREPKLGDLERLAKQLDAMGKKNFLRLETEVLPIRFVKPSSLVNFAKQRLSADGTVEADDDRGVIVLTDVKSKIARFKEVLQALDVRQKQVSIEARIVEARRQKASDTGIDWQQLLNSASISGSGQYSRSQSGPNKATETQIIRSVNSAGAVTQTQNEYSQEISQLSTSKSLAANAYVSLNLGSIIKILKERGDLHLLAEPNLLVVNNKSASYAVQTHTSLGKTQTVSLNVTPTIGTGEWISLNFSASVGESFYPQNVESLSSGQQLSSTVLLKSSETFVVSGLSRTVREKSVRAVPVLGRIVPFLFSRRMEADVVYDVAILLTPKVASEPTAQNSGLPENLQETEE